jgi:hypothetical protein
MYGATSWSFPLVWILGQWISAPVLHCDCPPAATQPVNVTLVCSEREPALQGTSLGWLWAAAFHFLGGTATAVVVGSASCLCRRRAPADSAPASEDTNFRARQQLAVLRDKGRGKA